jgi:DNA-binding Lrp family transcriptional regulator
MADLPAVIEPEDKRRAVEVEMEARRMKVLFLRHRRQTEQQIANQLNVSEATISRDIKWLREHYAETFGVDSKFDSGAFIGESIARYEDIESEAMKDSAKPGIQPRDKAKFLMIAILAREKQTSLLQDTGVITRAPVNVNLNLPTAAQIRLAIQNAALEVDDPNIIDIAS